MKGTGNDVFFSTGRECRKCVEYFRWNGVAIDGRIRFKPHSTIDGRLKAVDIRYVCGKGLHRFSLSELMGCEKLSSARKNSSSSSNSSN